MTPLSSFVLVTLAGALYAAGVAWQVRIKAPAARDAAVHLGLTGAGLVMNVVPVAAFMLPRTDWANGPSAVHAAMGLASLVLLAVLVAVGGALFRYKLRSGLYAAREDDAFSRKVRRGLRKAGVAWAALWLASYATGVGVWMGG